MENLFREHSQKIKIYLCMETETDPFEKTKEITYLPPLAISAIVSDLGFGKVQWQMQGVSTSSAKELLVEKRHKNLLEQSSKIEINNEDFEGYRINGKMSIKTEGEYIRIYIYRKNI